MHMYTVSTASKQAVEVCICVCVFARVFVIYEDTILYNDMGITLVLRLKHEI